MLERGGASSGPAAGVLCGAHPSSDGRQRTGPWRNMGTEPQELRNWLGDGWADYFARCGAAFDALVGSVAEAATAALKQHRKVPQFISWAALQAWLADNGGATW
eukprot:7296235-Pyramimonas_sp.AAC.1